MKNLTIEELAKVNGGYKSITYIGIDEEGTEVDLVKAGIGMRMTLPSLVQVPLLNMTGARTNHSLRL